MQARLWWIVGALLIVGAALAGAATDLQPALREVTILFTNDFESAYDPIPAFWRDDVKALGGAAQLATLIEQERAAAELSFLFDAGDIFTGPLAKLSGGELSFELMMSMGYDAMVIGNHEFEYGWRTLRKSMQRPSFPVLGANIFYAGTDIPFARSHVVVERDGFRVGVIGIIGQDAATALQPANVEGLEFRDPLPIVADLVAELGPEVDLVVLLTHQGWTAPMQTDAEAHPEVQRDIAADLRLAGAVPGIHVLLGGHADAGTEAPVLHSATGTLIMQTYGHGTRLGRLELTLDTTTGEIAAHDGRLLLVESAKLEPHPAVEAKLARYRARHPELQEVLGTSSHHLSRRYDGESVLGNLCADVLRQATGAALGLINSGALRADLAAGSVTRGELMAVFPFTDHVAVLELSGADLEAVLEQGLSLERGMLQVSGLKLRYDPAQPVGERLLEVMVAGEPLEPERRYSVATIDILAQGGDAYPMFRSGRAIDHQLDRPFIEILEQWVQHHESVSPPGLGRQVAVSVEGAATQSP